MPLVYFHIEVVEVILLTRIMSINAEVEGLADIKLSVESSSVDVSTLLCCLASSILVEWSERELEHRRNFSSRADSRIVVGTFCWVARRKTWIIGFIPYSNQVVIGTI